jgi:hypothetical protein
MVTARITTPWVATRVRNTYIDTAMPLMIRRPSRWAGSSAAKESSTSTMSATSRVTALPLRMATPTCAPLSARASFTPSPIIAT